ADLAIAEGEDTSADGKFTIENVPCVGACSIAPVVIVNKKVHGMLTTDRVSDILRDIDSNGKGR
ncbi:MAG: NAD(P)H-dependent oxidoreductase subunit E, partial [Nitrospirota bacterium]|nr:NAD(P)H-dependent oxidoreductase subunit E [Nitrospirota bacterium]